MSDKQNWPLWMYPETPNRNLNPRTTVLGARSNAILDMMRGGSGIQGHAGTPAGQGFEYPSKLATDDWISQQSENPYLYLVGGDGTQSGQTPPHAEPRIYDELVDMIRRYNRGVPQTEGRDRGASQYYDHFPNRQTFSPRHR